MKPSHDIVIAGAGPAGSSAAIRLANAGFSVALIEKASFPRQKLCGEFISPECLPHLEELGVMPSIGRSGAVSIEKTVFYARSGRSISIDSDWFGVGKSALGLSRSELDLCLLQAARQNGVEVVEGESVSEPIIENGCVAGVRSGNGRIMSCGLLIDATGRGRAVARFVETERPAKASHVAFKAHFTDARIEPGTCEIYAYSSGYGGCSGVEQGRFNLCFIASAGDVRKSGSDPKEVMDAILFKNSRANEALRGAGIASEWLAVPITRFGRASLAPITGMLTIGDAASFIDPFTGSGILMALESAKLAAAAIEKNFQMPFSVLAAEHEATYSALFDDRMGVAGLLRRIAFRPSLAGAAISLLSASSTLRRRLAVATRGPENQKVDSLQPSD